MPSSKHPQGVKRRRRATSDRSQSSSMPITDTPSTVSTNPPSLANDDYTVGWVCALPSELAASRAMLEREHPDLPQAANDSNIYTLGQIKWHNIVLACLPKGTAGANAAAISARDLIRSFPKVRFVVMVGVGGGAPGEPRSNPRQDIRLGDVIVSSPENEGSGIVQYDYGKTISDGYFVQKGCLNKPPGILLTGIAKLQSDHMLNGSTIQNRVNLMLENKPAMQHDFSYPGAEQDMLFQPDYTHEDSGECCENCDKARLVRRNSRTSNEPSVHYGLIGSANRVMRDGVTRERLRQERGIICFEMEAAGLMDNFPCLVIRGICDYSDTHKNKQWQPYAAAVAAAYTRELLVTIPPTQVNETPTASDVMKKLTDEITQIGDDLESIHKTVNSLQIAQDSKYRRNLLHWLSEDDYTQIRSDILRHRQDGTGEWFMKTTEFINWVEGKPKTLFCPGIPGSGKTMIASIVVEHLKNSFPHRETAVSSLYCEYKRHETQQSYHLLSSLLGQLAVGQPTIPEPMKELYQKHLNGEKPWLSWSEIQQAMRCVMKPYSRIFIVIDALDECETDVIRKEILAEVYELQKDFDVRLMATFRPHITAEAPENVAYREIRAQAEDIELYLNWKMRELPSIVKRNSELQYKIKARISTLVDGMFLLARLYIHSLMDKIREIEIDHALDMMQRGEEGLNHAYSDVLIRIKNQPERLRLLAKKVLYWIVCARRPLTVDELIHALAVEPGKSGLNKACFYQPEDTVSYCAGLVAIDQESNIIRLAHYTTQEYLERSFRENVADEVQKDIIATTCLTYLSFDVFAEGYCLVEERFNDRLEQYPFFDYAARHWGYHFQEVQQDLGDVALEFLMDDSKASASSQLLLPHSQQEFCGVHLAVYFGLRDILIKLLEAKDPNFEHEPQDEFERTPLSYAAELGNTTLVKLLLDCKADPNSHCFDHATPLTRAIDGNHIEIVGILLSREVELDYIYRVRDVRSFFDGWNHHKFGRRGFGDHGDLIDGDLFLRSPLSRAAEKGYVSIVELLLKNGAQPDFEQYGVYAPVKPLPQAIDNGHTEIVRILLSHGAEVNYNYRIDSDEGGLYGELGTYASGLLHSKVGEIKKEFRTPLSRAAEKGYEPILQLLLEKGAQLDLKDDSGQTALARADENGNLGAAQLLRHFKQTPDLELREQ
ncbi:hypothetical protein BJX63DRAFT_438047 [Aspergillus granulosus]|uniref:Nucleoside phosphorylase domain-containing protein n=1 Tax=Aspergillus granulosus TaxID=176169 RepID=A0ABR4GT55_9EURO